MSIGVTKNGNLYEKSNSAKTAAATVGSLAGAAYGYKNVGKIINFCDDVLADNASEKIKQAASQVKDTFSKTQSDTIAATVQKYNAKLTGKVFGFLKKNPVKSVAIATAAVALIVGTAIDNSINASRAKKIDKLKD